MRPIPGTHDTATIDPADTYLPRLILVRGGRGRGVGGLLASATSQWFLPAEVGNPGDH